MWFWSLLLMLTHVGSWLGRTTRQKSRVWVCKQQWDLVWYWQTGWRLFQLVQSIRYWGTCWMRGTNRWWLLCLGLGSSGSLLSYDIFTSLSMEESLGGVSLLVLFLIVLTGSGRRWRMDISSLLFSKSAQCYLGLGGLIWLAFRKWFWL